MSVNTSKTKRKISPVKPLEPSRTERTLVDIVKEPSTIAGVLTMVSQLALAGPGALTSPGVWAGVLSGIGLILTKEAK